MIKDNLTKDGTDNTIPLDIAKQMTDAFRKSTNADKGTYTEAAWFPANQMTSLIKKMVAFNGDGIRIYFGRYTSDIINQINKLGYGDQVPENYADMNTLLLVVTKVIDGKPHQDYFVDKSVNCKLGDPPVPTDPENRSELCPTMCDGDSPLM